MKKTAIEPHKSSLGMEANIAVMVMYVAMVVLSWIPGIRYAAWAVPIVFFVMEKSSKFVKFQAVQALGVGIVQVVFSIIIQIIIWLLTPRDWLGILYAYRGYGLISFIGTLISLVISVLVLYVVYMAYRYQQVELPFVGPIALNISEKMDGGGTL